ncbi:CDP-glucose 4,6-dehydratase [Castellaniella caeni]
MNPSFWKGRRVFLTGHTGFKGGWLSLWLQKMGAQVTGFSLPAPTGPSLFDLARVAEGMTSLEGDVRDLAALTQALKDAQPEIVLHLAAQALVRQSYVSPVETYASNVMGTVHLLEAVRQCLSVHAVVVVTTDKCYENREWVWPYRENEPLGGHDPYSSSKACAELVTSAYRRSFFDGDSAGRSVAAIASARAGNVIGGGDWAADRLVPDVIASFLQRLPVRIRHPQAIRPWQHVLEPLRGYLLLAQRLVESGSAYAEPFNFGPRAQDVQSVQWVVDEISKRMDGCTWQQDGALHPHEAHTLRLDVSKAADRLGWYPWLRLPAALDLTVDWVRQWQAGCDVRSLTENQIDTYMAQGADASVAGQRTDY